MEVILLQYIAPKSGRLSILFLISLLSISLMCACSARMSDAMPQNELHKPAVIDIYYESDKYSFTEDASGYEELFNAIETTWLSDKSLYYRAASTYDSVTLRGITRIYFIYVNPVEWTEGEYVEKYKGYCFLIPANNKADGEFICFTDDSIIGTDSEKYNGPRYYEYSEDVGEVVRTIIAAQAK